MLFRIGDRVKPRNSVIGKGLKVGTVVRLRRRINTTGPRNIVVVRWDNNKSAFPVADFLLVRVEVREVARGRKG